MVTLRTLRRPEQEPKIIKGNPTCANGHLWRPETTRWRYRNRSERAEHGYTGWERDCLTCREVARGRTGSGLRSQSWLPGATK